MQCKYKVIDFEKSLKLVIDKKMYLKHKSEWSFSTRVERR
jgi:hypothetical protein